METSNGADAAALARSYSVAPPVNVDTAAELLKDAKRIMDQLGVVFFLRQGTCLGAIRDKGIIPWDDDLDIGSIFGLHGVAEDTVDRVVAAFRANGFFAEVEHNSHGTCVAMMKSSTRLDWACYRVVVDSIFHYPGVRIPAKLFDQLKEIDFVGAKFLVPDPPEEYLRLKYGPEWMIPKKFGFEKDVLALVPDAPFQGGDIGLERAGKLRILDHEGNPVYGAEVRIAGVSCSSTDRLGYTPTNLPGGDWYALVIKYGNHEEVLYQEKMDPGQTYIYRPDPLLVSGRLCVLSTEQDAM